MNVAFRVGIACGALYLALMMLKALLSWHYLRRHPESELAVAPVTVLQPILGGDPLLDVALEQNLANAPAEARFWWLIDEDDPVGSAVAWRLAAQYPAQVRVVESPRCPAGINPKAFKLSRVAGEIDTEYVAVLDDDTILAPGHLAKGIAALARCDLYTGLPCYEVRGGCWGALLAHFVNNNSILTYLSLLNWMAPLSINGMFYMLRRATLLRWQGWETITHELCDDYAFAKLAKRHGGRICQGTTAQRIHTTVGGPRQYLRQMHRWFVFAGVLVHDQPRSIQCLLFALLGLPAILLWGSLLTIAGGWIGLALFTGLLVVRHGIIRTLHLAAFADPPRFSFGLSVLSELCQVVHYVHAALSPSISWRTRRIRMLRDGTFQSMSDTCP